MSILIVDDSPPVLRLLQSMLERAGYTDTICADCGETALNHLGIEPSLETKPAIDCILLDIVMPGMDGLEVCRCIKAHPDYQDIPVIMVTVRDDVETLRDAFKAGAHDYITKPARELELVARLEASITLKNEIKTRKLREAELLHTSQELARANKLLAGLSITDDLTKVGNRRYFLDCLENEWRRAFREAAPLSIIFVSIDRFHEFTDQQGRNKSERCLQLIAQVLQISLRRTTDLLSRYGDSLFAILLPKTPLVGAQTVAGLIQQSIDELEVKHLNGSTISVSQGLATVTPSGEKTTDNLITMALGELSTAQKAGGNQTACADLDSQQD